LEIPIRTRDGLTAMLQKKVCMIGTTAVGKTSLVRRFIESIYSDDYYTTMGVKTDKKDITVNGRVATMVLWDLYGWDEFQELRMEYLRGMHGYLLVADGTRKSTVEDALAISESIAKDFGKVPFVFLFNKVDLKDEWEVDAETQNGIVERGWTVMRSSAKTGENVAEAFEALGRKMVR
jgi:small GTP-binding protein